MFTPVMTFCTNDEGCAKVNTQQGENGIKNRPLNDLYTGVFSFSFLFLLAVSED